MDVKELLDDESLNPDKLFNKKEYNTLFVSREGFTSSSNRTADLLNELLDKELTREEQEEIFSKLKENKAQKMMVEAIGSLKRNSDKARICAACWESGLDFSEHILFFTELACSRDFSLAMEAVTVVENMEEHPGEEVLTRALTMVMSAPDVQQDLAADLIAALKARMA